jgi:hypothetical protein
VEHLFNSSIRVGSAVKAMRERLTGGAAGGPPAPAEEAEAV